MTPGVLILTGATAAGKTALALRLAERFDAEIIGADSRQIYAGMPVGTAAPTAAERERVPHHLVGFLDPHERYSAARFVRDALAAVDAIAARGRRALIVGGTGFYVRALAGDVALAAAPDPAIRDRLVRETGLHPPGVLAEWLAAIAPARAAALDPGDTYRVTRALEIALASRAGDPAPVAVPATLRTRGIAACKVQIAVERDELHRRIALRVERMLADGLLEEAERVGPDAVAADAVGYREALAYLDGRATAAELREWLARNTRRYAKRQLTWLRTEPDVRLLDPADPFEAAVRIATGTLPGWV